MKRWSVIVAAVPFGLLACAGSPSSEDIIEEHTNVGVSQSELTEDPGNPPLCLGFCPHIPDTEPLGQICWLDRQACLNGILTCYYHCEPAEDDAQLVSPGPDRRVVGLTHAAEHQFVRRNSGDGGVTITVMSP